jgi:predicted GNAT family acetyltransferase
MSEQGSVSDNAEMQQYELRVGEDYALAAYKLEGDTIRFTHTEVPEELEGQGIGSRLVKGALADVRRRGLKVVPLCAFVRHYIETHPETQDLLA